MGGRFRRANILGVRVDVVTEADVLDFVRRCLAEGAVAQIVTANAEYVMRARRDPAFAQVLAHADLATPDGAGVVWAMRRQGLDVPARVGGSDLIWTISELAARIGARVFLLGAAEGVAAEAAHVLAARFPGLIVAGSLAGSPAVAEELSIVDSIRRSRADIVLVAYGAPQQDMWIARNLGRTGARVGMGVGGSFDYVAGRARRAPGWMRNHGLDWLWRLMMQPWRWRRMLVLPHFAWLVLRATVPEERITTDD